MCGLSHISQYQLITCVRFVDVGGNIKEEFLMFDKHARITSERIARQDRTSQ